MGRRERPDERFGRPTDLFALPPRRMVALRPGIAELIAEVRVSAADFVLLNRPVRYRLGYAGNLDL